MKMKRALSGLLALLTLLSALEFHAFAKETVPPADDSAVTEAVPDSAEEQSSESDAEPIDTEDQSAEAADSFTEPDEPEAGESGEVSADEVSAAEEPAASAEEPVSPEPAEAPAEDPVSEDAAESESSSEASEETAEASEAPDEEEAVNLCGDGVIWSYDDTSCTLTLSYTGSGTGETADWAKDDPSLPWFGLLSEMKEVIVEEGVAALGDYAFCGAENLEKVTFSASLTCLGTDESGAIDVFYGCTDLKSITADPCNSVYADEDGVLYNLSRTCLLWYPAGREAESYDVPAAVTCAAPGAFSSPANLSSVVFAADAPLLTGAFSDAVLTVRYPADASGWEDLTSAEIPGIMWEALPSAADQSKEEDADEIDSEEAASEVTVEVPIIGTLNANGGITVYWSSIADVSYRLYWREPGGSWTQLDLTAASYTLTGLTSGKYYDFRVQACVSDVWGGCSALIRAPYFACPDGTAVSYASTGATLSWNAVSGADKYRVYYKTSGGGWTVGADCTSASCPLTWLVSGTSYSYCVKAYDSSCHVWSAYSDSVSGTYIAAPELEVTSSTSGISLAWNAVGGASSYQIQVSADGGSWTSLAKVSTTTYTPSSCSSGVLYKFRVRAVGSDGAKSAYSNKAAGIYVTSTSITSLKSVTSGIQITYSAVTGATGYVIQRSTDGKSTWKTIKTITATTYTDTSATNTGTYWYRVAAKTSYSSSGYCTAKSVKRVISNYAAYSGVNYYNQTSNELRLAVLDYAKEMCTVLWTSPCDMVTWCNSDGSYCSATSTDGVVSYYFMEGETYVGVPYSMAHTITSAEQWLSVVPTLTEDNSSTSNLVVSRPHPFTKYGTDCSYFISTCINAGNSAAGSGGYVPYITTSGYWGNYYTKESFADAEPGDIFLKSGHVRLFVGRTSGGNYAFFESTAGSGVSSCTYREYSASALSSYSAWSYDGYSDYDY